MTPTVTLELTKFSNLLNYAKAAHRLLGQLEISVGEDRLKGENSIHLDGSFPSQEAQSILKALADLNITAMHTDFL